MKYSPITNASSAASNSKSELASTIAYFKKFLMAALLVYCSQYLFFILGVSAMLNFAKIVATIVLRPFRLTF
jgi:hypothetical protein